MRQSRVAAWFGPTAVLYLILSGTAAGEEVGLVSGVLAASALLVALAPLPGLRAADLQPGARSVAALGAVAGAVLAVRIWPHRYSLLGELVQMCGLALIGVLVFELTLRVPPWPGRLLRRPVWPAAARTLGGAVAACGVLAVAPAVPLGRVPWVAPTWLAGLPGSFLLASLAVSCALRVQRRRAGADVWAAAADVWPAFGLALSFAAGAGVAALGVSGQADGAWTRGLGAVAALALSFGHAWGVDAGRVQLAGPAGRGALAALGTLTPVALVAARAPARLPQEPLERALLALGLVVGAALAYRLLRQLARRLLAPQGGRLLDALASIRQDLAGAADFQDLAGRVLRPLRRASGCPEAAPLLFTFAPDRELRLDAAGQPHVRARALPTAVARRLEDTPAAPILSEDLRGRLVRRPELRALVVALDELDALAVVPIVGDGELEGALVVPRGGRRVNLTLEELRALQALARALAPSAAAFSARLRADARVSELERARARLEEQVEQLEHDRERLRAAAQAYKAGRAAARLGAPTVAYSPAMRALVERLERAAPHDVPLSLVAEAGTPLDQLAHHVHRASGRADGPLVVADCGATRPEDGRAALFGHEQEARPGWLRLADGGTLLLVDLPSLSLDVQRELALALAERKALPVGGAGSYSLGARLVVSSRLPPRDLVARGALDPTLADRFEGTSFRVPSLRERREDLESLVLLALDRAARVLGREVPGIHPDAMSALAAYDWPGNVRELQSVIDRAVLRCRGTLVRLSDLPALGPESDPHGRATFSDQEREILRRALERAGGNKSKTARVLGLKRTTLLDKLRRHGLDDGARESRAQN